MNKKKSILFISGFYYPSQLGGPCNSNYWLVNALKAKNFYITVIATSAGIPIGKILLDEWLHDENGKVIYLNTKWNNFSLLLIIKFLREIKKVDIIQISSIFSLSSFIIGLISLLSCKPLIWSPRGELSEPALKNNYFAKSFFINVIKLFKNKIYFHVTSHHELNDLKFVFGNNVKYFLHANYIELPKNQIFEKKKQFLYLGRLHPIKSLDKLIQALNKSKYFLKNNFKLLIVGNGDNNYKLYLETLIKKYGLTSNINFLEHINDISAKNKLFSESLFTFLISESENFGNVVLESISNGTPVVSSMGTPWKILEDRKAGFWISNDSDSLTECIDKIINMNSVELSQYSLKALDLARDFDINNNIDKWVMSYDLVLKQHVI